MQRHVIQVSWSQYKEVLRKIRATVFIEEQSVPKELEWDGEDETSTHFLAINEMGQHIGCARLLSSGQIGRMAVLQQYRGTGIGADLLQAAVQAGQAAGFDRLFLHAQSYAEDFYKKGGFLSYGPEFSEAGIAHISMEMKLPYAYAADQVAQSKPPEIRQQPVRSTPADEEPRIQAFSGLTECSQALLRVVRSARRRILILSPYLDHELFDKEQLAGALSALARSAPKMEIHILIFDTKLIVDRGHGIIELARRLDEKIKIHVFSAQPANQSSSFVCADLDAYWLLPNFDKYDGVSDLANPVTCRRLTEVFETTWSQSQEDSELRALRL